MNDLGMIEIDELNTSSNEAPSGKEMLVTAVSKSDFITQLILGTTAVNNRIKVDHSFSSKKVPPSSKDAEVIVVECRLLAIFEDLQIIRDIRATRPMVPVIGICENNDPEFVYMIYQNGINSCMPATISSEILAAQITSYHSLGDSARIMEVKNGELVDTMQSLRKANEELKAQIGARINAELAKADAEKRAEILKQTKEILDNLREGFFTIDKSCVIGDSTSKACEHLFSGQVAGKTLGAALNLEGDKEMYIKLGIEQIFDNFMPFEVTLSTIPKKVLTKDGKILEFTFTVINDDVGEPIKVIIAATDITEHMAEKNRAQRRDELNRCLLGILRNADAFRNFITDFKEEIIRIQESKDLAEIKRLFHTLKGNSGAFGLDLVARRVQLAEDKLTKFSAITPEVSAKIQNYATIVEADVKTFLKNNHDIIQMSYESEHRNSYTIEAVVLDNIVDIANDSPVDIKERIELTLELIRQKPALVAVELYKSRVAKLTEKLGKEIDFRIVGANLKINHEYLSGVLANLIHPITNACDHGIETPEQREEMSKTPVGNIEILFEQPEDGYLRIILSDDGRGIDGHKLLKKAVDKGIVPAQKAATLSPAEVMNLIFVDELSTSDKVSDISGRGVGLAALKNSVEELNGTVTVHSHLGRGTKFEIFIPYPQKIRELLLNRRSPKVIICDDEPLLLEAYGEAMNSVGFETKLCANGLDAILEMSRNKYDLLITDLQMPGMTGAELITKLRTLRNDENILPIIVVSAYITTELRQALSVYPEVRIFEKPVELEQLISTMETILGQDKNELIIQAAA